MKVDVIPRPVVMTVSPLADSDPDSVTAFPGPPGVAPLKMSDVDLKTPLSQSGATRGSFGSGLGSEISDITLSSGAFGDGDSGELDTSQIPCNPLMRWWRGFVDAVTFCVPHWRVRNQQQAVELQAGAP